MSTKLAIVTAALLTVLAGPALAGDQDTWTELRDGGRYVPEAGLPEWNARNIPAGAFASARRPTRVPAGAFASAGRPTHQFVSRPMAHIPAPESDFQLQGR